MSATYKFRKSERLTSRKEIDHLFSSGESFFLHPFRVIWSLRDPIDPDSPASVAIAVPKKRFKKAVSRNRIRRLIRESYRMQKDILYNSLVNSEKQINFVLLYSASEVLPFPVMKDKILSVLKRLSLEVKITR